MIEASNKSVEEKVRIFHRSEAYLSKVSPRIFENIAKIKRGEGRNLFTVPETPLRSYFQKLVSLMSDVDSSLLSQMNFGDSWPENELIELYKDMNKAKNSEEKIVAFVERFEKYVMTVFQELKLLQKSFLSLLKYVLVSLSGKS